MIALHLMRRFAVPALLALSAVHPIGAQDIPAPLSFATGFAEGHVVADSTVGYVGAVLAGLGTGVLQGVFDGADQDQGGYTRREMYTRGMVMGGAVLLVSMVFSEWGTDPSDELIAAQPDHADHRAGFMEGYSSRKASRKRIGAAASALSHLVANALTIALSTEDDGTTYPLFSVQVPAW